MKLSDCGLFHTFGRDGIARVLVLMGACSKQAHDVDTTEKSSRAESKYLTIVCVCHFPLTLHRNKLRHNCSSQVAMQSKLGANVIDMDIDVHLV